MPIDPKRFFGHPGHAPCPRSRIGAYKVSVAERSSPPDRDGMTFSAIIRRHSEVEARNSFRDGVFVVVSVERVDEDG